MVERASEARDAVIPQTYAASLVRADPSFPSDAEVAAAHEANKTRFMLPRQFHLSQIVVLVPPGASHDAGEDAPRKAVGLRALAVKPNADFADLVKKQSQDRESANRGSDQGWVREDGLIPGSKDQVAGLPDNGTMDPARCVSHHPPAGNRTCRPGATCRPEVATGAGAAAGDRSKRCGHTSTRCCVSNPSS